MKTPTLCEVLREFGSDESCRGYLEALRWPRRVTCPRCESEKISRVRRRKVFDCDSCRYQFSVLAGTVLQDTKLPLSTWFAAAYLMCESRKGISANQVHRMIGGSYKTAWYLCHRIRAAMKDAEIQPKLDGVVEMDETYVGGHKLGRGQSTQDEKQVVIGIKQRNGNLRFFHDTDASSGTLARYLKENISEDVEVLITDSFPGYNKKLLKRGIVGAWHKVSAKHLQAYLDEMTWRFDNRNNPYLFRDTMMKLIEAPVLEYKKLTAA